MSKKWHRKPDGTPGECNATVGRCPYGTVGQHYPTFESCQEYCDHCNAQIEMYRHMANRELKRVDKVVSERALEEFVENFGVMAVDDTDEYITYRFHEELDKLIEEKEQARKNFPKTNEANKKASIEVEKQSIKAEQLARDFELSYGYAFNELSGLKFRQTISTQDAHNFYKDKAFKRVDLGNGVAELQFDDFTLREEYGRYIALYRNDYKSAYEQAFKKYGTGTLEKPLTDHNTYRDFSDKKYKTPMEQVVAEYNEKERDAFLKLDKAFEKRNSIVLDAIVEDCDLDIDLEYEVDKDSFESELNKKQIPYTKTTENGEDTYAINNFLVSFTKHGAIAREKDDYKTPLDCFQY